MDTAELLTIGEYNVEISFFIYRNNCSFMTISRDLNIGCNVEEIQNQKTRTECDLYFAK